MLTGIYPPIPSIFNEEGHFDPMKVTQNIKKVLEETIHFSSFKGFVVLGSNGEYPSLTFKEKLLALETVCKAMKESKKLLDSSPNKRYLIAGTGANSTYETIEVTKIATDLGYNAALVITPYYFKNQMNDEVIVDHFYRVANSSQIPIIIYNVPSFTYLDLSPSAIVKLSQHPNIIGIKESSGNIVKITQLVQESRKGFSVMAGSGSYFFPALMAGATGGVMALANVFPTRCAQLYDLYKSMNSSNDFQNAQSLQALLVPVNQIVTGMFGIASLKFAMERYGYEGGIPRLPLQPLNSEQKKKIESIFADFDQKIIELERKFL